MTESEEEYVMDFKTEQKITQLSRFDLNDSASEYSTASASEADSYDGKDSTPPLFYKLKKARVLIKKLPRDVLAKYIRCKEAPVRSSGRIKDKNLPVGKYLALHKNKPLNKVLKRNNEGIAEKANYEYRRSSALKGNIFQGHCSTKKPLKASNLYSNSSATSKDVGISNSFPNRNYSSHAQKLLCNEIVRNDSKNKESTITIGRDVAKGNIVAPRKVRSLHERIASTRTVLNATETYKSNVFARHIPSAAANHFTQDEYHMPKIVPNSINLCNVSNAKPHVPLIASYPKINYTQKVQSKVFPAFITPATSINESRQLILSNAAPRVSNEGPHCQTTPIRRKFSVQAFKTPNVAQKIAASIPVTSPKVFVVNQPALGTHRLSAPLSVEETTKPPDNAIGKENTERSNRDSDSVLETDEEKPIEPEVIKRIIYHSKSVQTKFTCNSSICGLVDSDAFNLNCFYCYEIFPLHKWIEFKEHIKIEHQVEEKESMSDSDIENVTADMQENDKRNPTPTKVVNSIPEVSKKLPLEPTLVAQRLTKAATVPSRVLSPAARAKPSKTVEYRSGKSSNSFHFKSSHTNKIISLDNDNCGLDIGDHGDVNKAEKTDRQIKKNVPNQTSELGNTIVEVNRKELILPSLPHITIKKVSALSPKESIDALKATSTAKPNEKLLKLSSTASIQKVIKALPKPTANQASADGKTRPRYFVVKKIIKLPTNQEPPKVSEFNIPQGTILTKVSLDSKTSKTQLCANTVPTNIEDSVPKPTSGLGILFGVTNSMVVIEFLLKLKSLPELWRSQLQNTDPVRYNNNVKKLCRHLNNRFSLNMTEFEMQLSIQRVKDWYYLMLRSILEHNKDPSNTQPYKHRFPIYFNILSQYLTVDAYDKDTQLNEIAVKSALTAKANAAQTTEKLPLHTNDTKTKLPMGIPRREPSSSVAAATPLEIVADTAEPPSKENSGNPELAADNLIEFDADTLYDQESSDEETLEQFDESMFFNNNKVGGTKRSYTKVYIASYECDVCRKTYKRSCDLKRHKVFHFPPQFECSRCSQKFYSSHMAEKCTHARKKKYKKVDKASGEKRIWPKKIFRFNMICEICGNSYRSIGSLNTHKRDKHFNQRNTCVVCNFTALSNWRIVQHQRKRHIVEPGLPEEVAKKSRARTESKTSFSNEARQAFDWRREMRKKLKPGEKFYGCCRCKIVFNTRKEKVLHNKIEHPITEFTVMCLLCLPNKLLLSNANCARRHYTDIHKVPWYEIDGLVKSTKPIFNLLNKEEIELLKASENYKELLDELLKDKKLQSAESMQILDDEATNAVQNLPLKKESDAESTKIELQYTEEQNVFVDGIAHDGSHNSYKQVGYATLNEHNYSEEQVINDGFNEFEQLIANCEEEPYSQQACEEVNSHLNVEYGSNGCEMENYVQNDHEYGKSFVSHFVEGELVEEGVVVEEYIDEVIGEDEELIKY